jgi:hypothetical protein
MKQRVLGQEHPSTLGSMNNLASIYINQGRLNKAESLQIQVLEMRRRVLGQEHPDTLSSMNNLTLIYINQGRLSEADSLQMQVLEMRQRVLGKEHPSTLSSMRNLVLVYRHQGLSEDESLQLQQRLAERTPSTPKGLFLTGVSSTGFKELKSDSGYATASRKQLTVPSESGLRDSVKPIATELMYDDIQSIASDTDNIRSQASNETTSEEITGKALIRVYLAEESQFRTLCEKALRKMSTKRFVENMCQLLKSFHKSLS